jgi:hypothetical protein
MAKFDFEVAVAFAKQVDEDTYNAGLAGIGVDPDILADTDGLLLGDPDSGVRETGLSLTLGRSKKDKAFVGASFTRSLSDFLKAEVRTFTFSTVFCGNRGTAATPPIEANATPITGIDALLSGCGLVGVTNPAPVGWLYEFGSPEPISALVYYFGNRLELKSCRTACSIQFTPGSVPILTATVEVGSVNLHQVEGFPVLDYGNQQDVSAPVIETVAHTWQHARGFSDAALNITPTFVDIGDSNATDGIVKEQSGREVTFEGTIFADDTTNEGHEYEQLTAEAIATLDPLSFAGGDAMTDGSVVEAFKVEIDDPEPDEVTIANLGTKAAHSVKLVARSATANKELQLTFI